MSQAPIHPRPVRTLIREFAEASGHTYEDLVGPAQRQALNRVRQGAMAYVKAAYPDISLFRLGQHFNRHWTTVRYSLHSVGVTTSRRGS